MNSCDTGRGFLKKKIYCFCFLHESLVQLENECCSVTGYLRNGFVMYILDALIKIQKGFFCFVFEKRNVLVFRNSYELFD